MNKPQGLKDYRMIDGKYPVRDWLDALDREPRHAVLTYIDRIREGNYGNCENKGGGLYEIKINKGPGYRVYYTWVRGFIVLLLCGGTKRGQGQHMEKAREYIKDHKKRC
jgi:putative addiction module killer protein